MGVPHRRMARGLGGDRNLSRGWRLGADSPHPGAVDLRDAFPRLRMNLLPQEQARMRALGSLCAEAMEQAIRSVRPGMTEHEIAARLGAEALRRGVLPIVNLVGTDGRISAFRHPLPTARVLDEYAMLVLCGRRSGLVCSVTRLIHFGRLPADLRRRAEAVSEVDAAFIAATRPGRRLSQVFQAGLGAYAGVGFPEEWRLHHQGGPAGYEPRGSSPPASQMTLCASGRRTRGIPRSPGPNRKTRSWSARRDRELDGYGGMADGRIGSGRPGHLASSRPGSPIGTTQPERMEGLDRRHR